VGRFLFLTAFPGGLLWYYFINSGSSGSPIWNLGPGMLVIFALLDARSRLQDYKKAKDLFMENSFKPRVANLFIHSKCQREAVRIAAMDLGHINSLDRYYREKGYRWYHIIPDFALKRPSLILTPRYWKKTLFAPNYSSLYFLW